MLSSPHVPSSTAFRRQAKALMRAVANGDPDALQRVGVIFADVAHPDPGRPISCGLQRCQHVIAREHGASSWVDLLATTVASPQKSAIIVRPHLQQHVIELLARIAPEVSPFPEHQDFVRLLNAILQASKEGRHVLAELAIPSQLLEQLRIARHTGLKWKLDQCLGFPRATDYLMNLLLRIPRNYQLTDDPKSWDLALAVAIRSPRTLVVGRAGSGKTHFISQYLERMDFPSSCVAVTVSQPVPVDSWHPTEARSVAKRRIEGCESGIHHHFATDYSHQSWLEIEAGILDKVKSRLDRFSVKFIADEANASCAPFWSFLDRQPPSVQCLVASQSLPAGIHDPDFTPPSDIDANSGQRSFWDDLTMVICQGNDIPPAYRTE